MHVNDTKWKMQQTVKTENRDIFWVKSKYKAAQFNTDITDSGRDSAYRM